jgi:hypothetical protein
MPGQHANAPASQAALPRLARRRFDRELQNQTLRNPAIRRASAAASPNSDGLIDAGADASRNPGDTRRPGGAA